MGRRNFIELVMAGSATIASVPLFGFSGLTQGYEHSAIETHVAPQVTAISALLSGNIMPAITLSKNLPENVRI